MCLCWYVDWISCDLNLAHEFLFWYTDFLALLNKTHKGDSHSASKSMWKLAWDQTLFQAVISSCKWLWEKWKSKILSLWHRQNIWPKVFFPYFFLIAYPFNFSLTQEPPNHLILCFIFTASSSRCCSALVIFLVWRVTILEKKLRDIPPLCPAWHGTNASWSTNQNRGAENSKYIEIQYGWRFQ